jgi:hypothetical protein
MCHQTAALVQRALDRIGIVTVSFSVLEEITRRARPSRALFTPFDLGYPLGTPFERKLHGRLLKAALNLIYRDDVPVFERVDPLALASG